MPKPLPDSCKAYWAHIHCLWSSRPEHFQVDIAWVTDFISGLQPCSSPGSITAGPSRHLQQYGVLQWSVALHCKVINHINYLPFPQSYDNTAILAPCFSHSSCLWIDETHSHALATALSFYISAQFHFCLLHFVFLFFLWKSTALTASWKGVTKTQCLLEGTQCKWRAICQLSIPNIKQES